MCPSESYTWGLTVGENYNDSNKYVPFRAFNLTPYMDDMRAVGCQNRLQALESFSRRKNARRY